MVKYIAVAKVKYLVINSFLAVIIVVSILNTIRLNKVNITLSNKEVLQDSTIVWLNIRYSQDSTLIRDIAVLTTDVQYGQVRNIFNMNNRSIDNYY